MAETIASKKKSPYMKFVHLAIGIVIAIIFSRLPGPGGISPLGMSLIGCFLVANYWFTAIDMVTGALAAIILFVLLSGTASSGAVTSILGNTTVWQMLIVQPIIYALTKTGATDALTRWMMSRKIMYGRPTLFAVLFMVFCSVLSVLKVHTLVLLALAESVMVSVGYEERSKEHDAFLCGSFFAGALASNTIPYGGWIASMVTSFESISGIPLDGATYMLFGILLWLVIDVLYVFVMKFVLRCDFSRLGKVSADSMNLSEAKCSKQGKFMLILFLIMILGAVIPTLFGKFFISVFISKTLGNPLWFTLCFLAVCIIPIEGKPVISPGEALKNGIRWPMLLSAAVMLYFAGIIGGNDAGIKTALSGAFSGIFSGMPGIVLLLVACVLTVIVTGFFSNMATGVIFMSATIPLASAFGLSPLVLGVCIMWASMPGYITPGGTGTSAYLHGTTTITKKNMYINICAFLVVFLVVIICFGLVMNII